MRIRAVLMDMDGTLLGNSQVAVSVRNMEALRRAIEKGVHVLPCTGRVYDMLPPQLLTQPVCAILLPAMAPGSTTKCWMLPFMRT